MDNKLILAILFVTLAWLSVDASMTTTANTMASTTNGMTGSSMTTTGNTMASTTNGMTGSSMTTTGNTMASTTNGMTGSSMTTTGNTMASTTNGMTGSSMTTTGNTMASTTNGMTGSSMTTTGNTMASTNVSVAAAPPLTPNVTVETLETPISNVGCGSQQLCAAEPSACNPSVAGSCFFLAVEQQSGQIFEFRLSGQSTGYIAATLSTDTSLGGNDTTYVCANDNGVVKFIGTFLNDGQLIEAMLNVNSVKGSVNGEKIQCTFAATVPSQVTSRASNFALGISTGTFNSSSGALGNPNTRLRSTVVDLQNPSTVVSNEISTNNPTSPPIAMTTNHAITLQQSLTQALLITVGVLGMAML
ncbi:putative ferric-chelate reductase 1 [Pempheris klunzingeri]|uniref:putative ferric-chelate reductase 1 n=1 Tax=Pempheris klunzingeri TaxID=3127111 RepID=UPI00397EF0C8